MLRGQERDWLDDMIALTVNESGVVACLLDGLDFKQTVKATGLSERTVCKHMISLRQRLGAKNRVDLALKLDRIARGAA